MKRLRSMSGMTLTEMLCSVLVLLLVSALLTVGVNFSVRCYRESMAASEAQVLCSTLTTAISDKLRYSTLEEGSRLFLTDCGSDCSFYIKDGRILISAIVETGGRKEYDLLGFGAYPRGLKVVAGDTGEKPLVTRDEDEKLFTVAFAVQNEQGDTLAKTEFQVKRING